MIFSFFLIQKAILVFCLDVASFVREVDESLSESRPTKMTHRFSYFFRKSSLGKFIINYRISLRVFDELFRTYFEKIFKIKNFPKNHHSVRLELFYFWIRRSMKNLHWRYCTINPILEKWIIKRDSYFMTHLGRPTIIHLLQVPWSKFRSMLRHHWYFLRQWFHCSLAPSLRKWIRSSHWRRHPIG